MSDEPTIWHNPRCSKSRQTLQLLRDRGIEPIEVDYQKNPPSIDEITSVLKMLDIAPRELMRKGQDIYRELNLADEKDDARLIEAMFHHPVLIERPVVINGTKASLGRPPEAVLAIL
ncbi:MAG: arsenate reductase (glutaredoxin) [Rhizobiaceae bacterium]|nr:arsenate reductase (glutaredoxin) [Rhizobiaceae bacterium]